MRIFFTHLNKNLSTKKKFIKGRLLKYVTFMIPNMEHCRHSNEGIGCMLLISQDIHNGFSS